MKHYILYKRVSVDTYRAECGLITDRCTDTLQDVTCGMCRAIALSRLPARQSSNQEAHKALAARVKLALHPAEVR